MELTKKQANDLKLFLASNAGMVELDDYNVILSFIDAHTMTETAFDLNGEQTDDMKEVYAYMMRESITKLDTLKKQ